MEQFPFSSRHMVRGEWDHPQAAHPDSHGWLRWSIWGASIPNLAQNDLHPDLAILRAEGTPHHRLRSVRVLFVSHDAELVDTCLQELKKAQFIVSPYFVSTLAQVAEQLRSHSYDVVLAGYPSPCWEGLQDLKLLHQTVQDIPLLFVTTGSGNQSVAELTAHGLFDYIEREHIAQLPLAVRRAVNEKKLREELEGARRALRHSQSLYRALVDNPAYGIFRCSAEGKILAVNQALLTMLGYSTKEELLAEHHLAGLLSHFGTGSASAEPYRETLHIEPVETEWKRENGTTLKVRISGRGVFDDHGNLAGHEIIAVDITDQRTLEDQLRLQALSDSLTGLANHRRLFEVLHVEICRSKRTEREFSLLLLDLDGLKQVNDRHGHQTGDRALCRLGRILRDCCRSVDTAARHGGDEFALVLPETNAAAARLLGRRICELLERETEEPGLSVSVGIASYPKDADTIGTLLYAADRALYVAKDERSGAARDGQVS